MDKCIADAPVEEQNADIAESLNQEERETLAACEEAITTNIHTFVEVGEALRAIRDGRLYRESHDTFQAYCRERWDLGRAHSYRLIAGAQTMAALSPLGDILPTAETQLRPLLQFPLADRPKVWEDVRPRIGAAASRSIAGRINEIVQSLVRSSDEEPYRQRRAELRKEQRERLGRAEERKQQRILEAGVTSRRQQAPLSDGDLNQLGNMVSVLQDAYVRTRSAYEAIDAPNDHAADRMVMAIEVSIRRLAQWVAEQQEAEQSM